MVDGKFVKDWCYYFGGEHNQQNIKILYDLKTYTSKLYTVGHKQGNTVCLVHKKTCSLIHNQRNEITPDISFPTTGVLRSWCLAKARTPGSASYPDALVDISQSSQESNLETCEKALGDLPTPGPSNSQSGNSNERAARIAHKSRIKTKEGAR